MRWGILLVVLLVPACNGQEEMKAKLREEALAQQQKDLEFQRRLAQKQRQLEEVAKARMEELSKQNGPDHSVAVDKQGAGDQQPVDKVQEAKTTLKAFCYSYGKWVDIRDKLRSRMENCMWGNKRYPGGPLADENPQFSKCKEQCLSKELEDAAHWDCFGECWAGMGGKQTVEGRKGCHKAFVKKLKPILKNLKTRSEKSIGCEQKMYDAVIEEIEKGIIAEMDEFASYPPDSPGNPAKEMDFCLSALLRCGSRDEPCDANRLGRLMGISGPYQDGPSSKVSLFDGTVVNKKSVRAASKK